MKPVLLAAGECVHILFTALAFAAILWAVTRTFIRHFVKKRKTPPTRETLREDSAWCLVWILLAADLLLIGIAGEKVAELAKLMP